MATPVTLPRKHPLPVLKRWAMAINGCNVPAIEQADVVTRWLVISRACVFSMTFTSGLIGLLLAAEAGHFNGWLALLCLVGLLAAHGANNLINDWIDTRRGVDTEDYPRAQYSTHPILGGLTTSAGLLKMALALNLVDAGIMLLLAWLRGPRVIAFALAGLLISLAYTGYLKRFALGELAALVVWGPLMIGGTYFVVAGELTGPVWWLTLPYGLIVASVLIGKHVDKSEPDRAVGVRSLPVLLGTGRALALNRLTFLLFYLLVVALVWFRLTGPWVLVTVLAVPRLVEVWRIYGQPKPGQPPEGWTVWPLWFVGWAMYFNRRAGELFVLGLLLNLFVPWLAGLVTG